MERKVSAEGDSIGSKKRKDNTVWIRAGELSLLGIYQNDAERLRQAFLAFPF